MTIHAQESSAGRLWPIPVALVLGVVHPILGAAFAFLMAAVRRSDRRVAVALVVIGALLLFWLSLFMGVSSGSTVEIGPASNSTELRVNPSRF